MAQHMFQDYSNPKGFQGILTEMLSLWVLARFWVSDTWIGANRLQCVNSFCSNSPPPYPSFPFPLCSSPRDAEDWASPGESFFICGGHAPYQGFAPPPVLREIRSSPSGRASRSQRFDHRDWSCHPHHSQALTWIPHVRHFFLRGLSLPIPVAQADEGLLETVPPESAARRLVLLCHRLCVRFCPDRI